MPKIYDNLLLSFSSVDIGADWANAFVGVTPQNSKTAVIAIKLNCFILPFPALLIVSAVTSLYKGAFEQIVCNYVIIQPAHAKCFVYYFSPNYLILFD